MIIRLRRRVLAVLACTSAAATALHAQEQSDSAPVDQPSGGNLLTRVRVS